MSEPRHAAIYKDCEKDKWFLEIVPYDLMKEQDAYSHNSEQFGFFDTPEEAEQYAENNFQNTGFGIPVLGQLEFVIARPTLHLVNKAL
jgi:hypothetical protein